MRYNRPSTSTGENLSWYRREARKFPMLSADAERALCLRWRDNHDISAAHQLANSHLRLVGKLALGYGGYGLPIEDLTGEGHVGLMRAVCRFDPDRGVRFATYAIWWVRAAIQEYILHNWSLVKIGTTASQKKLFFNLRRIRGQLQAFDDGPLKSEHVSKIADILGVTERDVISMNQRMSGPDRSLDTPVSDDSPREWQSLLVDDRDDQETVLAAREEITYWKSLLPAALKKLSKRELNIITERYLKERPAKLDSLSLQYGVSRERIRQIEVRAMDKLRRSIPAPASPHRTASQADRNYAACNAFA
jgi:RNA polymerase sigma-32 factor